MQRDLFTLEDLEISVSQEDANMGFGDFTPDDEMMKLLNKCEDYWNNMDDFRERRERSRRYYRGEQWEDRVTDPDKTDGSLVTERELIERQGRIPLVNNQIRQLVRNILGQYRDNDYKPVVRAVKREDEDKTEMMTNTLQYIYDINDLTELDIRTFEEAIISGAIIQKTGYAYMKEYNREHPLADPVNPARVFVNSQIEDPRGKDINLIGEIIDIPLDDMVHIFGNGDPEVENRLLDMYANEVYDEAFFENEFGSQKIDNLSFYVPTDRSQARIFEIWRQERKKKLICHDMAIGEYYEHTELDMEAAQADVDEQNAQRIEEYIKAGIVPELPPNTDEQTTIQYYQIVSQTVPLIETEVKDEIVWMYYYLTPRGHVIQSGETPFEHEQHPYAIKLYPMVDGEVWGFIEDIIDQQRHVNRYISLIDFIVGSSAKGALMIPEDAIPDGMTLDEMTDQWVRANGVIIYKPSKTGQMPQQVSSNSTPAAAVNLLQLELQLLKEIGGVSDAIQGQSPNSGTPASLYAQMANNSTLSMRDFFQVFFSWKRKRDLKLVQIAQQFYDEEIYLNTSGVDYKEEAYMYNPKSARDAQFDVKIDKSAQAPVYRDLIEQNLLSFLQAGFIDFPMYLENTTMPGGGKLLQQIKEKQAQLESMGVDPNAIPPIQGFGGGDPDALKKSNPLLSK